LLKYNNLTKIVSIHMTSQNQLVLDFLTTRGAASSSEIRSSLGASQPTMSRILSALSDELIILGAGKRTQYAKAHPIGVHPSQQPLWLVGEDGIAKRVGTLSFLEQSQMAIEADGVCELYTPQPNHPLPWYLSGLRAQGFLGRILAQKLSDQNVPANPELWDSHATLLAALHTHDAPGAFLLGSIASKPDHRVIALQDPGPALDALSQDVAKTLPMGSSAGGEQPKFPVRGDDGVLYLVKFSPPRGTPFGDRWSDLLFAEALSSVVLNRHGYSAAISRIVQTEARTYLLSERFDRCGLDGRKHVLSIGDAHRAFVKGPYGNWALTCDALVRQKRLSADSAEVAHAMVQFGRLIGNTDMHSGNAGLFTQGQTLAQVLAGRFEWAPVYDMLPMRWKPDPMLGGPEYAPFAMDVSLASTAIRAAAADFWQSVAQGDAFTLRFRHLAGQMVAQFLAP
jgi:hypothetical protein